MLSVKSFGAACVICIAVFVIEHYLAAMMKMYTTSFDHLTESIHQLELNFTTPTPAPPRTPTLIIYSYFETEEAKLNMHFFLRHGLHAKADFIFMMNDAHTIEFPSPLPPNVRIISRENKCYDLGGFHEILTANITLARAYNRFILMNASLRGPFFPAWASDACWSDAYLGKLNARTKLVGMTWNCVNGGIPYPPHIQSMMLATDSAGMGILLQHLKCYEDMHSAVAEGETQISTWFRDAGRGYDVATMEARFEVHAGRDGNSSEFLAWCTAEGSGGGEDVWHSGNYGGVTLHPYETIFVKTNRDWNEIDRRVIDTLTVNAEIQEYSSYEKCI